MITIFRYWTIFLWVLHWIFHFYFIVYESSSFFNLSCAEMDYRPRGNTLSDDDSALFSCFGMWLQNRIDRNEAIETCQVFLPFWTSPIFVLILICRVIRFVWLVSFDTISGLYLAYIWMRLIWFFTFFRLL